MSGEFVEFGVEGEKTTEKEVYVFVVVDTNTVAIGAAVILRL